MKLSQQLLCATSMGLLCAAVVGAQESHQHRHQAAEQLGQVNFPISCRPEAQGQFNRAAALLHSFEYDEAEKAFSQVAEADPSCGIGHWGAAMSVYHPLWAPPTPAELKRGAAAIAKAKSIGAKTERERAYIAALDAFYQDADKADHRTRALAYEQAMERVYRRYPEDREAAIFYALALNATALAAVPMDKSYAKQKKAAEVLNRVLPEEPNHPGIAHYLIHSYDYPQLAPLALAAARSYAKIAPSSPHALHMPSHIFTRLGLWQESIQSNLASAAAAKDYALKTHMAGAWDEQLHAMDYLAYAYLQGAQDRAAKGVLDELRAIRKAEPENFKVAYTFAAVPARYALERRRWSEAAALTVHPSTFPWDRHRYAEAITYFARAVGAARSHNASVARQDLDRLIAIQKAVSEVREGYDWATQVEIQRRAAAAWLAQAEGKTEEALQLLHSAAGLEDSTEKHPVTPGAVLPAREMLGDLLLELNRPAQALIEFETSLRDSPNRFNGLYGAARAAELSGDRKKARAYYTQLKKICSYADSARPELQRAKEFLANK